MASVFSRLSERRAHLSVDNPLRSLTEVIDRVPDGINLGQGVCDLDPPRALQLGAVEAITGGTDRQVYTPYAGVPELREQIARKLRAFNRLAIDPEQVCVTLGSSGAFYAACLAVLDPGDEVILFEPFYSYHYTTLELLEARPVCVRLSGPDFALDLDRLRAAITPKSRAIVVNTPANPSGKVFSRGELEGVAEILEGTRVVVLTDEVYEYMCYDGRSHVSPAAVEGLADRSLTISSYSKTFSVTGWRIGFAAGPQDAIEAIGRICDQIHVCAPRPMQRGVQRALAELPDSFYADLQRDYQRKRDRFCAALETAGFEFARPDGSYYVLAGYRPVLGDREPYQAVLELIERARINGVPGDLFYAEPDGVRSIRLHFAVEDEVLEEACQRLERLAR